MKVFHLLVIDINLMLLINTHLFKTLLTLSHFAICIVKEGDNIVMGEPRHYVFSDTYVLEGQNLKKVSEP